MAATELTCTDCQQKKHIDGFPNRNFAQCWDCAWDAHIHSDHPKTVKRIRREAKRRARRITERQLVEAMTEKERRQALGVKGDN